MPMPGGGIPKPGGGMAPGGIIPGGRIIIGTMPGGPYHSSNRLYHHESLLMHMVFVKWVESVNMCDERPLLWQAVLK